MPEATARLVNSTRQAGGRVIAVGTTVTRALESAADAGGTVRARRGWTDLVLGPARPARVVTGLVTGWHAPGASHLALLAAVAGPALVERAYAEAVRARVPVARVRRQLPAATVTRTGGSTGCQQPARPALSPARTGPPG